MLQAGLAITGADHNRDFWSRIGEGIPDSMHSVSLRRCLHSSDNAASLQMLRNRTACCLRCVGLRIGVRCRAAPMGSPVIQDARKMQHLVATNLVDRA